MELQQHRKKWMGYHKSYQQLNINGLNSPIKWHKVVELILKKNLKYAV